MQEEVLVHHEEGVHLQLVFHLVHDIEQLVTTLEKVDEFTLASEKGGSCAEVASHGAADRGNDCGCGRALGFGQTDPHDPRTQAGNNGRMTDGCGVILVEIAAHPGNPFAPDDVIGVDHVLDAGNCRPMPAHHDRGVRRELADHAAHLAYFRDIHDDRGDSDDVVALRGDLARKIVPRREIKNGAGRGNIRLDQHDAPGAMKHAQRKATLCARDLVVIKLHGINGAAAELVVLRVRAEDRAQQNAGLLALWVLLNGAGTVEIRGMRFHCGSSSILPTCR